MCEEIRRPTALTPEDVSYIPHDQEKQTGHLFAMLKQMAGVPKNADPVRFKVSANGSISATGGAVASVTGAIEVFGQAVWRANKDANLTPRSERRFKGVRGRDTMRT